MVLSREGKGSSNMQQFAVSMSHLHAANYMVCTKAVIAVHQACIPYLSDQLLCHCHTLQENLVVVKRYMTLQGRCGTSNQLQKLNSCYAGVMHTCYDCCIIRR